MELVIGVLIKTSEDQAWMEHIVNLDENDQVNLGQIASKINDVINESSDNIDSTDLAQNELSIKNFEKSGNNATLEKRNRELKEIILSLESDLKTMESEKGKLEEHLQECRKENDDLYQKYEKASKNQDYQK